MTQIASPIFSKTATWLSLPKPVLFAGAGVGARVGYPDWHNYIGTLAEAAHPHCQDTARLIIKTRNAGNYLHSAHLYKTNPDMPAGEKLKKLAEPFRLRKDITPLQALLGLPMHAVATTNFDHSMHDCCTALRRPHYPVEYGDPSMKSALYSQDFYIARIHGRAEVPESLILDTDDFTKVQADPVYNEFLLHLLTRCNCLFIGFSFVDPAIQNVLHLLEKRAGPDYPSLHTAFVPKSPDSEKLRQALARFNIEVYSYSPNDQHAELWQGIAKTYAEHKATASSTKEQLKPRHPYLGRTKTFLAVCYTRRRLGSDIEPLKHSVIEGIVLSLIRTLPPAQRSSAEVAKQLKKTLNVTQEEATDLADDAIERLSRRALLTIKGAHLVPSKDIDTTYQDQLATLAKGSIQRLHVRFSEKAPTEAEDLAASIIEEVIARRGAQLCASFAGHTPSGETADIWTQIQSATQAAISDKPDLARKLAYSVWDLISKPNSLESEIIADLSRLAFGVELALNSAQSSLVNDVPLPERIYLDASVLMPAITPGHPFHALYVGTIKQLEVALKRTGRVLDIVVAQEFLNEVISHRRKAIQAFKSLSLKDKEKLSKHALYYGAENTNVYLGAFASTRHQKAGVSFTEWLDKVAPYQTETQLSHFLKELGIRTSSLWFSKNDEVTTYESIFSDLDYAYSNDRRLTKYPPKPRILIEHEARQLARLTLDLRSERRCMFVTADKRLRMACARGACLEGSHAIVSHMALVQLVDLIIGIKIAPTSFARALWMVRAPDELTQIRSYLTDLALRHYDDALIRPTNELLDKLVPEIQDKAKKEGVTLFPHEPKEMEDTARFLDRFEDDFFLQMDQLLKQRAESKG